MEITSAQNPRIKRLLALQQKSAERRREGLFVVEGLRELQHCLEGGYQVDELFVCPGLLPDGSAIPGHLTPATVPLRIYEKVAYRGSTEGVIAVVHQRSHTLNDLAATLEGKQDALLVVLESVEKPGNLGAVLRSADAAGADAVIACDPLADLYNPNRIRSSVGAVFTVPVAACSSQECIGVLKRQGISILTAQLQDSHLYYNIDMRRPTAIVLGTESTGLTQQWRQAADAHIRIPMLGRLDSLNVSVSAAILLFEAVRQRQRTSQGR